MELEAKKFDFERDQRLADQELKASDQALRKKQHEDELKLRTEENKQAARLKIVEKCIDKGLSAEATKEYLKAMGYDY